MVAASAASAASCGIVSNASARSLPAFLPRCAVEPSACGSKDPVATKGVAEDDPAGASCSAIGSDRRVAPGGSHGTLLWRQKARVLCQPLAAIFELPRHGRDASRAAAESNAAVKAAPDLRAEALELFDDDEGLRTDLDDQKHTASLARTAQRSHRRMTVAFLAAAVASAAVLIPLAAAVPFFAAAPYAVCLGLLFAAISPATNWLGGKPRSGAPKPGERVHGDVRPELPRAPDGDSEVRRSEARRSEARPTDPCVEPLEGEQADGVDPMLERASRKKASLDAEMTRCGERIREANQTIARLRDETARHKRLVLVLVAVAVVLTISLFGASIAFPFLLPVAWGISALPLCAAASPLDSGFVTLRRTEVWCRRLDDLRARQTKLKKDVGIITEHVEKLKRWKEDGSATCHARKVGQGTERGSSQSLDA